MLRDFFIKFNECVEFCIVGRKFCRICFIYFSLLLSKKGRPSKLIYKMEGTVISTRVDMTLSSSKITDEYQKRVGDGT